MGVEGFARAIGFFKTLFDNIFVEISINREKNQKRVKMKNLK